MEKVSGLIITYNEERNIAAVLSCFNFCDEIIVVDSFSTDKTVEIAQKIQKSKFINKNLLIIQNKGIKHFL